MMGGKRDKSESDRLINCAMDWGKKSVLCLKVKKKSDSDNILQHTIVK